MTFKWMPGKRMTRIAAALAGLTVAIAVAAMLLLQSSWFFGKVRHLIVSTVETASGGRVEVGAIRFDWTRLRAEVDGFVVHGTEPAGKPPLFRAGSVAVGLKIVSIFERNFDIQYLDVRDPHIYLIVGPDGRTNVPEPKIKPVKPPTARPPLESILNLAIGRFNVTRGAFEVESQGQTPFAASGRNLNVALGYDRGPFPNGRGSRYRGAISMQPLDAQFGETGPGSLNQAIAVALNVALNVTMERNRIGLESVKLTHGASQIDISGAIEDLTSPRGSFRYDARVSVVEVAQIVHVKELQHGVAQVTGTGTWSAADGVALTGKLHAVGVEYRDAILRLAGFRVDGSVAAGSHVTGAGTSAGAGAGIDAGALRLSGDYVSRDRHTLLEGTIAGVALRGKNLDLAGVAIGGLGGSFHGDASLRDLNRYNVIGEIGGIEVKRFLALLDVTDLPWDGRAAGPVHLDGSFRRAKDFRAGGNITLSPPDRGDPVNGQATLTYIAESGTLDLGRSTLTLPHSRVDFSGVLGRQLTAHLETSDLHDLLPALGESAAKLPLKLQNGVMIFDGTVTGKLDSPQIEGHTRATHVVYSGEGADSLEADVTLSAQNLRVQNGAVARGALRVQFDGTLALDDWKIPDSSQLAGKGSIQNAALADVASLANAKDLGVTGTLSGSAQITGTVADPRISADFEVAKGNYRGEPVDRLTAHVNYSGRTVVLSAAQIVAGPKQIQLTATFDHAPARFDTGRLRFQVTTNTIALEQIHTLQEARPDAKGTVQLTAHGDIDLAPPSNGEEGYRIHDLHASVEAKGMQLTGQALGDANLTMDSKDQVLHAHLVSDVAHCDIQGDGQWRLEGDYEGNAVVTFAKVDLAQLRDWISPTSSAASSTAANSSAANSSAATASTAPQFAGSAEGEVRITGPILKPAAMKAELRIAKFEIGPAPASGLAAAPLTIHNAAPIVVRMANSIITVDTARFTGRSTDLALTGRVSLPQKAPLDLRVSGHLDLGMLQDFIPDLVSAGTVATDATIRGTFSAPQVTGRLEFRDAAFNLADVPNGISNAQGVILFNADRATIQSLKGETGGGQIELSGFTLYGAGPLVFRLHASAHEVRIRYPEGVSTVADASLNFTGTEERSMLAGTITILRSGINLQSDFSSLLAKSAQPVHTPSAQPGLIGGMNFDVQIDTSPDIQFQSSLTENLQAEANLKLRGTASNPALLGRINITQGQLTFFGVSYTINQGSIAFYNPVKVEPILNIDLETKARGVDVTLTVSGPATKPTLTPRSDPPLQFNEIVALLATGRTPTSDPSLLTQQSSEPQSWQQIGASALLGQAIANPVAGRLQRFFGVSKLRIDPTLSGVENNPQARLTLEQQVTPSITFTYITNVTTSNPQVIRVEWAFAKQWSAVALREENGLFGLDFFYKRRYK